MEIIEEFHRDYEGRASDFRRVRLLERALRLCVLDQLASLAAVDSDTHTLVRAAIEQCDVDLAMLNTFSISTSTPPGEGHVHVATILASIESDAEIQIATFRAGLEPIIHDDP